MVFFYVNLPILRYIIGNRHAGQPMIVNEASIPFWNQYRYEEAFVLGAYSAFQGVDSILHFVHTSSSFNSEAIHQWEGDWDPIAKANVLMMAFLYGRGDVKTGEKGCALVYDEKTIQKKLCSIAGSMMSIPVFPCW